LQPRVTFTLELKQYLCLHTISLDSEKFIVSHDLRHIGVENMGASRRQKSRMLASIIVDINPNNNRKKAEFGTEYVAITVDQLRNFIEMKLGDDKRTVKRYTDKLIELNLIEYHNPYYIVFKPSEQHLSLKQEYEMRNKLRQDQKKEESSKEEKSVNL